MPHIHKKICTDEQHLSCSILLKNFTGQAARQSSCPGITDFPEVFLLQFIQFYCSSFKVLAQVSLHIVFNACYILILLSYLLDDLVVLFISLLWLTLQTDIVAFFAARDAQVLFCKAAFPPVSPHTVQCLGLFLPRCRNLQSLLLIFPTFLSPYFFNLLSFF